MRLLPCLLPNDGKTTCQLADKEPTSQSTSRDIVKYICAMRPKTTDEWWEGKKIVLGEDLLLPVKQAHKITLVVSR